MNNVKSIKIPKELTPFLLTAIFAVKNSEWNGYYAIDDFHIYINPIIRKKEKLNSIRLLFFQMI